MSDDDPYATPGAPLARTGPASRPAVWPSPLLLCLLLWSSGLLLTLLLYGLDYLFGRSLPGEEALTTLLPAYLTGLYVGRRRGAALPAALRRRAYLYYVLSGVLLSLAALALLHGSGLQPLGLGGWRGAALALALGFVVLLFGLMYGALVLGEQQGVRLARRRHAR